MVVEATGQATDVSLLCDDLTESLEWNRGRLKFVGVGASSLERL